MQMLTKIPKQFYFFLAAIFILNLVQSSFTQLIFDEAYYWYYSQKNGMGLFWPPTYGGATGKTQQFLF